MQLLEEGRVAPIEDAVVVELGAPDTRPSRLSRFTQPHSAVSRRSQPVAKVIRAAVEQDSASLRRRRLP
ncbi:MAG: hypothetical protein U0575_13825 [Phycisphaerales bacterium]|jgi:hypothetical protein